MDHLTYAAGKEARFARDYVNLAKEMIIEAYGDNFAEAQECIGIAQVHATIAVAEAIRDLLDVIAEK